MRVDDRAVLHQPSAVRSPPPSILSLADLLCPNPWDQPPGDVIEVGSLRLALAAGADLQPVDDAVRAVEDLSDATPWR